MTQANTQIDTDSSEELRLRKQKRRSLYLALALAGFAALFYVTTILKMSANLSAGS